MVLLRFVVLFSIAGATWGLAFGRVWLFAMIGAVLGLIPALMTFAAKAGKRGADAREMEFAGGMIWTPVALLLAVAGIVAWGVRVLF